MKNSKVKVIVEGISIVCKVKDIETPEVYDFAVEVLSQDVKSAAVHLKIQNHYDAYLDKYEYAYKLVQIVKM